MNAVLKLIGALTGDRRYEEAARAFSEEGAVMRDVMMDRLEEQGRVKGRQEGLVEGKVDILYTKLHYSPQDIADEVGEPVSVVEDIIKKLQDG